MTGGNDPIICLSYDLVPTIGYCFDKKKIARQKDTWIGGKLLFSDALMTKNESEQLRRKD